MNEELEKIEEDSKRKIKNKKEHKISGRSVFTIQKIIREKSEKKDAHENKKNK